MAEEGDGKIVGAAVAVMWGALGLIGPVAVLPNYQNQDIGQQLVAACQGFFDENKAGMQGLVTYPHSPKHLSFYQRFGYRPRGLVTITAKSLDRREIVQAVKAPKPGLGVRRTPPSRRRRRRRPSSSCGGSPMPSRAAWTWARRSRSWTASRWATPCCSRRGAR